MYRFIFERGGEQITAVMPEMAGYDYAKKHGYMIVSVVALDHEPTEGEDINAMLVDHEFRILMLELGLIE